MFEDYIKQDKNGLIKNLQDLIKIPSVHVEGDLPEYPFGKNTVKCHSCQNWWFLHPNYEENCRLDIEKIKEVE